MTAPAFDSSSETRVSLLGLLNFFGLAKLIEFGAFPLLQNDLQRLHSLMQVTAENNPKLIHIQSMFNKPYFTLLRFLRFFARVTLTPRV